MHVTVLNLAEALLWAAVAGLATWFVLIPIRRRSLVGLLASLVLTGAAASIGCLWGAVHAMLVPAFNWQTMLAITAFSALVAAAAAVAAGRRLARDTATLLHAVTEVGEGRIPAADGRQLTAEVEQVRTELRATAEALAATRDRERALESARRELVTWVSHDLRTPLAGLRAMAEALEDGVIDDPTVYYKQIGISVDRLNQMVEDLFDLSRIQAGGISTDTEHIALDDLISDCVSALEPLAVAQGVRLTGSIDGRAAVLGNGSDLNRALTNLVANAIRHTRAEGHVDVRLELSKGSGTRAEVVVSDECGGIPQPHLERLFDVGFRGETARTPHPELHPAGAGLGLAITRGIVEAHAGTVEVSNTSDGCQFRLQLPVAGV
jgi:signal transduction histidine kinase